MKKVVLWVLIISVLVGMLTVISLTGCKTTTETTAAEAEAETAATETTATETAAETAAAKGPINIGVLTVTSGAFAQLGQDEIDGVNIAFEDLGFTVAGREINIFIEGTDITPETAVDQMRAAVERDKCQIVIGPLSGAEGTAVKNSAGEWPDTTILVASSAAENVTTRGIAENVWRTSFQGMQPMHPFGEWAYDQGYKKIVTLGEDYDFPWAHVGGFLKTFTDKGGQVVKKYWVPIGTSDYSSVITDIPEDVDAIYLTISGTDVINFLTQMASFGLDIPILGGTTSLDSGTLTTIGEGVEGVCSGSVFTGVLDRPQFQHLYDRYFALRGRPPGLFTAMKYNSALIAAQAIEAVDGNIEDIAAFREALQNSTYEGVTCQMSFDDHHQIILDVFINEVQNVDGVWKNVPIKTYPAVNQFWTYDPAEYEAQPLYDKETIDQLFPNAE